MSRAELNPEPMRVLVVDDTPDLRDLITMALERTGEFEVVAHAENGRQAIDSAAAYEPDLVLLDIAMPVMDGLEALPLVRAACPDAIVVMHSSSHVPSGWRVSRPPAPGVELKVSIIPIRLVGIPI